MLLFICFVFVSSSFVSSPFIGGEGDAMNGRLCEVAAWNGRFTR